MFMNFLLGPWYNRMILSVDYLCSSTISKSIQGVHTHTDIPIYLPTYMSVCVGLILHISLFYLSSLKSLNGLFDFWME